MAGTVILTATGLVAIENIKVGDKVISTNPETFETAEKTVIETYVHEVSQLVHLTINNETVLKRQPQNYKPLTGILKPGTADSTKFFKP